VRSHPAWFDAKNRHNSAEDFVEDVRRTWRLAAQTNETNETKETNEADQGSGKAIAALGLEARYALILASVNSFGAAIPLALVVALVRGGAWDVRQAIGYARRIPEPDRRLTALSELLSLLPDPLRTDIATEAFGTALRIQAEQSHRQPTVPDALAACLPEDLVRQALEEMTSLRGTLLRRLVELGFLDDAVRLARQNWDDQAALVPYLREEQVRRWLAEKTGGYGPRAELGVRLAALGYPDEALKLARTFKFPDRFFADVVRYLPAPALEEAYALASELLLPNDMVFFLSALAQTAPEADRARFLDAALTLVAQAMRQGGYYLSHIDKLIPLLDERQLDRLMAIAGKARPSGFMSLAGVYFAIARASAGTRRDAALKTALEWSRRGPDTWVRYAVSHGWPAVDAYGALRASIDADCVNSGMEYLAPELPRDLLPLAVSSVTQGVDAPRQRRFERQLAAALAGLDSADGWDRLQACRETERAEGLMDVAGALPDSRLEAAVGMACEIRTADLRAPVLQALAPRLSPNLLDRALDACDGEQWASSLRFFVPYLPPAELRDAVTKAKRLSDHPQRAQAYLALADRLPPPELPELEDLSRALARPSREDYHPNEVYARLFGKLAERFAAAGEYRHAIDLLADIPDTQGRERNPMVTVGFESYRVDAVNAMADSLPPELVDAAIDALGPEGTAPGVARLACRLDPARRGAWLETAKGSAERQAQTAGLALLAVYFADPTFAQVLDRTAGEAGEVIPIVAPYLAPDLFRRAVGLARSMSHRDASYARGRSLTFLALAASADGPAAEPLLEEALDSALDAITLPNAEWNPDLWRRLRTRTDALPARSQHLLLRRALFRLSDQGRPACLAGLGELVLGIGRLGGPAALAEVQRAASDVARWWP
jgi:hypothetical protein